MLADWSRMSDNRGVSRYSADFENLFGSGKNGEEGEEEGSRMTSVQPTALLAEASALREDAHGQDDVTPSILLEQLAYVDNFMPSLEQEYATLDSWILSEGQEAGAQNAASSRTMGFDERLAAELSAFADDSFIFPDEDKRQQASRDGDGEGDNGAEDGGNDSGAAQSNSHFLTQRRNTFLTSQYDHSKSRFSSRRKRPAEQQPRPAGRDSRAPFPVQDHGGFVNVDIAPSNGHSTYAPAVRSPLNSLVASQPYSLSNTPETTASRGSWKEDEVPPADEGAPRIQLPDYSKIPTSTLVALLPRVTVPPAAYQSLIDQGLGADQIDAIAVIIANYEQEKQKRKENGQATRPSSSESENAANNGASFLIDILSDGSQPRRRERSPTPVEDIQAERRQLQSAADEGHKTESTSRKRSAESSRRSSESPVLEARELKRQKSANAISIPGKSQSKKKVKESELESSVHELSELAVSLQQKIRTLEMENELLKNLVISSGESQGVERAEKIKTEILKKINETRKKANDSKKRDTTPKEESL